MGDYKFVWNDTRITLNITLYTQYKPITIYEVEKGRLARFDYLEYTFPPIVKGISIVDTFGILRLEYFSSDTIEPNLGYYLQKNIHIGQAPTLEAAFFLEFGPP